MYIPLESSSSRALRLHKTLRSVPRQIQCFKPSGRPLALYIDLTAFIGVATPTLSRQIPQTQIDNLITSPSTSSLAYGSHFVDIYRSSKTMLIIYCREAIVVVPTLLTLRRQVDMNPPTMLIILNRSMRTSAYGSFHMKTLHFTI